MYKIAIVGRPNVGKSTFFNRIVEKRHAITGKTAGITRDRISAIVKKENVSFEIADTGGYGMGKKDSISEMVKKQIETAIENADTVLFICDVTAGAMPGDEEILSVLRKSGKDIILIANKADNDNLKKDISEFYKFGIERVYPVSALHNIGISRLIDDIIKNIRPAQKTGEAAAIKVAIVGKPNVGKSSFINRIAGEERVIVHEEPGTTRDSVDICMEKEGRDFIFIDTAGIRHKRKVKEAVDVYSLLRAKNSIKLSDVCLVMIDGYEGPRRDDIRVLKLVEDCGKGCVFLVNKWDLVNNIEMSGYEKALVKKTNFILDIPVLFTSCKSGLNLEEIFPLIELVDRNAKMKFSEQELRDILILMEKSDRLPLVRSGELIKIRKIKQEETTPQVFSLYVSGSSAVTNDYISGIRNILREELGLKGAPIRIIIKRALRKKGGAKC
ncbi:MAG: ribosome biogenesis GTPase Der [Candidatus Omnitrophota bacterium]|nr:ribosome biogenesis GTPase Der [Candidatus Omnitrophota bacterium]